MSRLYNFQMDSSFSGSGEFLSFSFCILILLSSIIIPSSSVQVCKPASCGGVFGPQIRFPFRLKGKHIQRCGYPGFDLSCNNSSQTILTLPHSGDFVVNWINYSTQAIYIDDPDSCLPKRISNFNVHGSPFRAAPDRHYMYFNCSLSNLSWSEYATNHAVPLDCPGDFNSTIMAIPSYYSSSEMPSSCRLMPNVSIPLQLFFTQYWSQAVVMANLKLIWNDTGCRSCEQKGLYCGFKSNSGLDVGCSKRRRGLPRGAKYGLIIGVGIPGLVCLIGVVSYACGKFRDFGLRRSSPDIEQSAAGVNPPPLVTVSGLDGPTIESYPKTVIGESCRLPKLSDDGTCPICLAEYQPKETLRSIPECNHYFHATCIDEWLKLNGTCPMCRNSPESNAMTPCSSMSSTFSTTSSA